MFSESFTLSYGSPSGRSIVSTITSEPFWSDLRPGVYNEGLLTVCDSDSYGPQTIEEWGSVLRPGSIPFAFNAWGDVFVVSFGRQPLASILLLQERSLVDFGHNPFPLLDSLLSDSGLSTSILRAERFGDVCAHLGPLEYGQCFVLEPIARLGGNPDNPKAYIKGDFGVYLSIAAQG